MASPDRTSSKQSASSPAEQQPNQSQLHSAARNNDAGASHQPINEGLIENTPEPSSSTPTANLMQTQTSENEPRTGDAIEKNNANDGPADTSATTTATIPTTSLAGNKKFCGSRDHGKDMCSKVATVDSVTHPIRNRILNDAYLIRDRCLGFNPKTRKDVELMCEEKVSKYKLEEVHCSLPSSVKTTFIMTFSPDGQRVASTHGDHRIYICDLNTGKLLDTLEGHPKTPWCLTWHPNNREILASGCLAGEVRVWDLRTKACESWTNEVNTIVTSLDFHPKERILIIATANDIHFWDWGESEPLAKTTTAHAKEKVKFVVFDSSGTKLITGISNLPKFAGYSSDSLQHRIIDSYLTHGNLDNLQTENMTQNSEIPSPLIGSLNQSNNFNDRIMAHQLPNRQSASNSTTYEQDLNYRSTLTLSRVAFLYRQLEALEDSMRHTAFSPYTNPRPVSSSIISNDSNSQSNDNLQEREQRTPNAGTTNIQSKESDGSNKKNQSNLPPTQHATSQVRAENTNHPNDTQPESSITSSNSEPLVVSFDESLEHIHLSPLIIDDQEINLANIIEQYPIELPYQLHYMMQFESMNQVNQNFIRISKMMSSFRLYRQIVQQIRAGPPSQGHFQPGQILTAQSSSARQSRTTPNLPMMGRNFPMTTPMEPNELLRGLRGNDPIMAIQFRNAARNVPLGTICKIDLLAARCVCIMRSQQLVEQTILGLGRFSANYDQPSTNESPSTYEYRVRNDGSYLNERNRGDTRSSRPINYEANNITAGPPFHHLLNQLHQSMVAINHAPLTTSNVFSHITSLRNLINKLLTTLLSMFQTENEGRRIIDMILNIAESLTGRNWNIPLGATLDDIRLDVIHILCVVDLTLHLTRQIQLLQLQRLSAVARIEESRRYSSGRTQLASSTNPTSEVGSVSSISSPVPSGSQTSTPTASTSAGNSSSSVKRKDEVSVDEDKEAPNNPKKRKVVQEIAATTGRNSTTDVEMLESNIGAPLTIDGSSVEALSGQTVGNLINIDRSAPMHGSIPEPLPTDRLVIWNSPQNQSVEQSLQRFLIAAASNMTNSHILVRIYHRLNRDREGLGLQAGGSVENPLERPNQIYESRRRALSQDHPHDLGFGPLPGVIEQTTDRSRQHAPVNILHAASSGAVSHDVVGGGLNMDSWQVRHPHLHVYQTRGPGQHLWFNQWTIPLPVSNSNYRLQCWDFSMSAIPDIKDPQSNIVTTKCRILNNSSVDLSSDGMLVACLVPRDDGANCLPSFDLKIFSLKAHDFGVCYYQLPHGPNAISVSLSPSASYAVVGLASNKFISNDPIDDDLTIAKVFKLNRDHSHGFVRDIKIKRNDSSLSLNAIRWMSRGIVYNVGPQHGRYQATNRMRNRNL